MAARTLRLVRPGDAPPAREPVVPNGVLGMLIFIMTEVMLFAGLISAYTVVRTTAVMWPPAGQPRLPAEETAINTAALLASGVALYVAVRMFRKTPAQARIPVVTAGLLGVGFVGLQGREWAAMLAQGFTLHSGPHGAFFYTIIGVHGFHALVAILALGWAGLRLFQSRLTLEQLQTVAVFWYFVVGVWPVLYWKLYF